MQIFTVYRAGTGKRGAVLGHFMQNLWFLLFSLVSSSVFGFCSIFPFIRESWNPIRREYRTEPKKPWPKVPAPSVRRSQHLRSEGPSSCIEPFWTTVRRSLRSTLFIGLLINRRVAPKGSGQPQRQQHRRPSGPPSGRRSQQSASKASGPPSGRRSSLAKRCFT